MKVLSLFLTAQFRNENGLSKYDNCNTDVIVKVEEEEDGYKKRIVKYVATFFTYSNILEMKTKHFKSGEYLNGKYFFFKNMIIIDDCSHKSISEIVNHLIEEGEFREIFKRL